MEEGLVRQCLRVEAAALLLEVLGQQAGGGSCIEVLIRGSLVMLGTYQRARKKSKYVFEALWTLPISSN